MLKTQTKQTPLWFNPKRKQEQYCLSKFMIGQIQLIKVSNQETACIYNVILILVQMLYCLRKG